jgi:hypothetical protein
MCHGAGTGESKLELDNVRRVDLNRLPRVVAQEFDANELRLETISVIKHDSKITCVVNIEQADIIHILSFRGERKCDGASIFVIVGFFSGIFLNDEDVAKRIAVDSRLSWFSAFSNPWTGSICTVLIRSSQVNVISGVC